MLLEIWEHFIQTEPACLEADQLDIDELDKMMRNAELEAELEFDYDPWDDDNFNSDTKTASGLQNVPHIHVDNKPVGDNSNNMNKNVQTDMNNGAAEKN